MAQNAKKALIDQLAATLNAELTSLRLSAAVAAAAATDSEAKPENKYDTRGLEASYLAGAQKERVAELQGTLEALRGTPVRAFGADDLIGPTALVELDHNGVKSLCLLVLAGAGFDLDFQGRKAVSVSLNSPLGKALAGKRLGETATIHTPHGEKDYEIIELW